MPENTELVENDATQGAPAEQPERTFTQAEMDAIIGERLKRDRQKYANDTFTSEVNVSFSGRMISSTCATIPRWMSCGRLTGSMTTRLRLLAILVG